LLGLFSGYLESVFLKIGSSLNVFIDLPQNIENTFAGNLTAPNNFGSVSAPALFLLFVVVSFFIFIFVKFFINRKQKVNAGATWDCGVNLKPRMEINATGFAGSIVRIFNLNTRDIYQSYLYQPLKKIFTALSLRTKVIQSGSVNMYVFYILIAVVLALILL
jgi:preprotein translocase subunit YajC